MKKKILAVSLLMILVFIFPGCSSKKQIPSNADAQQIENSNNNQNNVAQKSKDNSTGSGLLQLAGTRRIIPLNMLYSQRINLICRLRSGSGEKKKGSK